MNKTQLIEAIKLAKTVFAWNEITEHDGKYIKVVKANLLLVIHSMSEEIEFRAILRDDGDLYLN